MFIPLQEILDSPIFQAARPQVLSAPQKITETKVRWVHATELLDIAHLLRGGELLLSTGQELLRLKEESQIGHLRELAERGISALVLEPYARHAPISPRLIEAAEQIELPLVWLHHTVPFVDITERINRSIVSKQASTLQQADMLSQRLAQRIAQSGPNLTPLLQMISDGLGLPASLRSLDGRVLVATRGTAAVGARGAVEAGLPLNATTDIIVGGDVAAHLLVECRKAEEAEYVSMIVQRLGGIISLAFAQHHRPSRSQVANHALMHAIIDDAGRHYVAQRAQEAGVEAEHPVCMGVVQSYGLNQLRGQLEKVLQGEARPGCISLQNNRLYFLMELDIVDPRRSRDRSIGRLREALQDFSVECAVGPMVSTVAQAPRSLKEAQMLDRFPSVRPTEGRVRDASEYSLDRLFAQMGNAPAANAFVHETIGDLLEWDRVRRGELVSTLHAWLESGCNATATAAALYLERQTLHKRLKKIFSLLGGDPRSGGMILPLHLACRIQYGQQR